MQPNSHARASEGADTRPVSFSKDEKRVGRKEWMAVLARARGEELGQIIDALPEPPVYTLLKEPETGAVMIQARAGGVGRRFNLGETTCTRCVIRLAEGTAGYSYALGRDLEHAECSAVLDAMLQGEQGQELYERHVRPLAEAQRCARELVSRKAAATKVNFFTLVRGDD